MDSVSTTETLRRPDVILFTVQVIVILLVVIVSLVNLTLEIGQLNLWTVLLTSCLGYILPNPKFKNVSESIKELESIKAVTTIKGRESRDSIDFDLETIENVSSTQPRRKPST